MDGVDTEVSFSEKKKKCRAEKKTNCQSLTGHFFLLINSQKEFETFLLSVSKEVAQSENGIFFFFTFLD